MLARALRFAAVVLVPLLVGCSYTRHEGVMANGATSQLYFSGSSRLDLLAVGYAATVTVQRYGPSDVPCTGLGLHKNGVASGGIRIQGGSLPDPDHCDGRPSDAVTLVSASCTDDTCSVTTDTTDPRAVTITVTGARAGTGHLAVSLKSGADGNTYEDDIPLRFEVAARIRLAADPRELAAMTGPVLPGVAITKPRASVVDAADELLEVGDTALIATTDGDAFADTQEYPPFKAQHAGHTVLRWSYTGVADRTIDLEVVDPSEARALFVYAPLPPAPSGISSTTSDVDPADAPPAGEPASGRITSIELVENDYGTFPFRVRLVDGRFAVATVEDPELTPAALGSTLAGLDLSAFDLEGKSAGSGTITLRAAPGATTTLPVKVTARPAR
jgi:hypothetical protein